MWKKQRIVFNTMPVSYNKFAQVQIEYCDVMIST